MSARKTQAGPAPETLERLSAVAQAAVTARLSADEEKEATELLKVCLGTGKGGIEAAAAALPKVSWTVGVDAVVSVWPAMKVTARRTLLAALAGDTTEPARRFRMSLARGLATVDPDTTRKLLVAVSEEIKAGEGITPKDRNNFANVFIGKGKPWLAQLPWAEWKGTLPVAEAVVACLPGTAPFTQLGVIAWMHGAGLIPKLDEDAIGAVAAAIERWPAKIKRELLAASVDLPEPWKTAAEKMPPQPAPTAPKPEPKPVQQPSSQVQAKPRQEVREPAPQRGDTLAEIQRVHRQIEAEFARLRNELQAAKQAGKAAPRREPRQERGDTLPAEEVAALQRYNAQLEATVAELRAHLDELAADHEDRAVISAATDDPLAAFRALLGVKLAEAYEAHRALRAESLSEVVRLSYRDITDRVFSVLESEGVRFGDAAREVVGEPVSD